MFSCQFGVSLPHYSVEQRRRSCQPLIEHASRSILHSMRNQSPTLLALFFAQSLLAAAPALAQTAFEQQCAKLAARKGDDTARLQELFKLDWDYTMREYTE